MYFSSRGQNLPHCPSNPENKQSKNRYQLRVFVFLTLIVRTMRLESSFWRAYCLVGHAVRQQFEYSTSHEVYIEHFLPISTNNECHTI